MSALALLLLLASAAPAADVAKSSAPVAAKPPAPGVLAGIDVLEADAFQPLKGKRIGLITNPTGIDRRGRSSARVLAEAEGVQLKALFSIEHGAKDGAASTDSYRLPDGRSIPVYSLRGATLAPASPMLGGLDALVFDVQDVGSRFYSYPAAMALAMEAAAARDIDFIVLDRPDPVNGESVAGTVLDDGVRNLDASLPVAIRHGMTIGELARLHNMAGRVGARLQVVPMRGWSRSMWLDGTGLRWVKPSPDLPDLESAGLYPGVGCLEAANVSVGRGTPSPFRLVGAPWMDEKGVLKRLKAANLKGYAFETEGFKPTRSVYKNRRCRGIRIRVLDRAAADPLRLFAHLVCALRDLHPMEFGIRPEEMVRLTGTERFLRLYQSGASPKQLTDLFESDAARFKAWRTPFLLY